MRKIAFQHGDVLGIIVDEIPKGAKKLDVQDGFILERGEGVHTHIFPDVSGIEVYEHEGQTYVRVSKETFITHEEHGNQAVKTGIYRKQIEKVWDYEEMEARRVID